MVSEVSYFCTGKRHYWDIVLVGVVSFLLGMLIKTVKTWRMDINGSGSEYYRLLLEEL